jgi:hypothetical protein
LLQARLYCDALVAGGVILLCVSSDLNYSQRTTAAQFSPVGYDFNFRELRLLFYSGKLHVRYEMGFRWQNGFSGSYNIMRRYAIIFAT